MSNRLSIARRRAHQAYLTQYDLVVNAGASGVAWLAKKGAYPLADMLLSFTLIHVPFLDQ